jgi:hypothetical protein
MLASANTASQKACNGTTQHFTITKQGTLPSTAPMLQATPSPALLAIYTKSCKLPNQPTALKPSLRFKTP